MNHHSLLRSDYRPRPGGQVVRCPFCNVAWRARVARLMPRIVIGTFVLFVGAFAHSETCRIVAEEPDAQASTREDASSSEPPGQCGDDANDRLAAAFDNMSPEMLEMAYIPKGTYKMGSPIFSADSDVGPLLVGAWLALGNRSFIDQGPEHDVSVEGFCIGKYEVTVEHFVFFLNATDAKNRRYLILNDYSPVHFDGAKWKYEPTAGHQAINTVTWYGANAFCEWLSRRTGDHYRLPSEAEWEWAAKGKVGRMYPWGITIDQMGTTDERIREQRADIKRRADWGKSHFDKRWKRLPVGSFPLGSTPEGVMDMVGGVWEWCEDEYTLSYAKADTHRREPRASLLPSTKVLRGGTANTGDYTMTTTRLPQPPSAHQDAGIYGFRIIREKPGVSESER